MIKVLIVDDSPVARELIEHILSADPEVRVIGTARNGLEALAALEHKHPDVVTMDVHMPGMDGFETTRQIMMKYPTPVVIVTSTLDPQTDSAVFRTLEAGALAILLKPPGFGHPDHARTAAELLQTVRLMSEVKVVRRSARRSRVEAPQVARVEEVARVKVVAIGASTGGPVVVQNILSSLPADFPVPVLVVQHMAEEFIGGFAEWLSGSSELKVKVGEQAESVTPGFVYVAPGGSQMGVDGLGRILLTPRQPGQYLCPSVTHLFLSVAERYGNHAVGVLLTGMGADGALGLKEMQARGALTIAQDEESCVVYGMPAEAVKLKAVQHVLPPQGIIEMLLGVVKRC
ncbi:chemotaxis-specific protein-glutamate methyltransferase CheB [Geomonas sp.]|uniref:chemotaxis-specific protein-glutamate methyltransferase CheB n=1 Tax=Geomonas sp. TaxID=2651584 RepID=UPI002B48FF70|nr:chemotaxis-specific protein-glutamate methyltransferase CheB [Geomonas sp.]HJV34546.1 chemotaxis-specific protein-glutamate methyltransferase CheB [Geomonas sp.]